MDAVLDKLIQSGHAITGKDWVRLEAIPNPQPFNLEAREYPGFVTDLQPPPPPTWPPCMAPRWSRIGSTPTASPTPGPT